MVMSFLFLMEEITMKSASTKISLVLAIMACILSVVCIGLYLAGPKKAKAPDEGDVQYVLYLGTNDKDTNEPVFTHEESKKVLKEVLISHFGGYTIQEANGGWIGDDGMEYQEYTLVIYLSDANDDDVHAVCRELIKKFNQSSILIQTNRTKTEFYSGE